MRILDNQSKEKLGDIILLLTKIEALHLIGYLEQLIENEKIGHSHLMSEDDNQELTVCVYDADKIEEYSPRIQKLIKFNE